MGLESITEKDACDYLEARGGMAVKFLTIGLKGLPDRAMSHPACGPWLMEIKAPGKTARKDQKDTAQMLANAGWRVYLNVDTIKMAREVIDDEIACRPPRHPRVQPFDDGFSA